MFPTKSVESIFLPSCHSGATRISQAGRRRHQPLSLEQKVYIWQDFCQKIHENVRKLTEGHVSYGISFCSVCAVVYQQMADTADSKCCKCFYLNTEHQTSLWAKTFNISARFAMYLHGMISNCNIDRSVTLRQCMFLDMKSVDSQSKLQQVHVYTSFDPHVNFIESI